MKLRPRWIQCCVFYAGRQPRCLSVIQHPWESFSPPCGLHPYPGCRARCLSAICYPWALPCPMRSTALACRHTRGISTSIYIILQMKRFVNYNHAYNYYHSVTFLENSHALFCNAYHQQTIKFTYTRENAEQVFLRSIFILPTSQNRHSSPFSKAQTIIHLHIYYTTQTFLCQDMYQMFLLCYN